MNLLPLNLPLSPTTKRTSALFAVLFLVSLSFFFVQILHAAVPNPGHAFTETDLNLVTKTGDATLLTTETVVLADATTAAFTLTLPSAASVTPHTVFFIKKIDAALANFVMISGSSGQTIDGLAAISLAQRGESVTIIADGTNWRILQRRDYDINAYRAKGSTLNQWFTSPATGTALTTGAPTLGVLRAIPFIASKTTTLDQMAINVTVAGSATNCTADVGIYSDNGNSYPGARVVDAGSAVVSVAGVKTFTTGMPVTLDPGLYWLVYEHNCATTAPTIRSFAVASLIPVLGYASSLPTNQQFGWSVAFTYAALPASYPAGGAPITAVPIPAVFVRTSS
jgi:hypothetical protein